MHRDLYAGSLKTETVSRTPTGKCYISILTDDQMKAPDPAEYPPAETIGVDVGIKTFAALSTGEKIENPKYLKASLSQLKCLQRRVSRKVKGSKNRKKAIHKLAKLHEPIANQSHDFQRNLSKRLISENQAVDIETLNIQGMNKNRKLAQSVSDSAWYSFVSKLVYKAEWMGKLS